MYVKIKNDDGTFSLVHSDLGGLAVTSMDREKIRISILEEEHRI